MVKWRLLQLAIGLFVLSFAVGIAGPFLPDGVTGSAAWRYAAAASLWYVCTVVGVFLLMVVRGGVASVRGEVAKPVERKVVRRFMPPDEEAVHGETEAFRCKAIMHVSNEALLEQISRMDASALVRSSAQNRLRSLAEETKERRRRLAEEALTSRLRSATKLELVEIARSDPDPTVRYRAIEFIDDQGVLAELAANDPEEYVCTAAIKELRDQRLLEGLALHHRDWRCRVHAARALPDKRRGQELIVAMIEDEPQRAEYALEYVTDRDSLMTVAKSPSFLTRLAAAKRLFPAEGGDISTIWCDTCRSFQRHTWARQSVYCGSCKKNKMEFQTE